MSILHSTRDGLLRGFAAMLALGLASGAPPAAAAVWPTVALRLAPAAGASQPATQLVVFGHAPLHCAPTLGPINTDGTLLDIELDMPQTGCDTRRHAGFTLTTSPPVIIGPDLRADPVLRVRVYARSAGSTELVAFRLLDTRPQAAAPVPENGFWWSGSQQGGGPASPGMGVGIEWQAGQLAANLFGFDDMGAPSWSFGSTRLQGRVASIPLVQLANGDPPFAPLGLQPEADAGPRLEIEFLSPVSARAWLVRHVQGRDVEMRALSLTRSRFASGPAADTWSGQWVLVPDEGGPASVFEFSEPSSRDAASFHLTDTASDASLDCRLAAADGQPDLCALSVGTTPLADFDEVGLDHLVGRDPLGRRVRLVRVPR